MKSFCCTCIYEHRRIATATTHSRMMERTNNSQTIEHIQGSTNNYNVEVVYLYEDWYPMQLKICLGQLLCVIDHMNWYQVQGFSLSVNNNPYRVELIQCLSKINHRIHNYLLPLPFRNGYPLNSSPVPLVFILYLLTI